MTIWYLLLFICYLNHWFHLCLHDVIYFIRLSSQNCFSFRFRFIWRTEYIGSFWLFCIRTAEHYLAFASLKCMHKMFAQRKCREMIVFLNWYVCDVRVYRYVRAMDSNDIIRMYVYCQYQPDSRAYAYVPVWTRTMYAYVVVHFERRSECVSFSQIQSNSSGVVANHFRVFLTDHKQFLWIVSWCCWNCVQLILKYRIKCWSIHRKASPKLAQLAYRLQHAQWDWIENFGLNGKHLECCLNNYSLFFRFYPIQDQI